MDKTLPTNDDDKDTKPKLPYVAGTTYTLRPSEIPESRKKWGLFSSVGNPLSPSYANMAQIVSANPSQSFQEHVELKNKIKHYVELRHEEAELRWKKKFLEEQSAQYGPLNLNVDVAMRLKEETNKLNAVKDELIPLEAELLGSEGIPLEGKANISRERLANLIEDIRAKKEQILIYQQNIEHLEKINASFGLNSPISIINDLKLTQKRIEEIHSEVKILEEEFTRRWGMDRNALEQILRMNDEDVEDYANQLVMKQYQKDGWDEERKKGERKDREKPLIIKFQDALNILQQDEEHREEERREREKPSIDAEKRKQEKIKFQGVLKKLHEKVIRNEVSQQDFDQLVDNLISVLDRQYSDDNEVRVEVATLLSAIGTNKAIQALILRMKK